MRQFARDPLEIHMPDHPLPRHATVVVVAAVVEVAHLGWEALHGGIQTHHLLARADLPGFSNAWGLLLLPCLAGWASWRWQRRAATRSMVVRGLLIAAAGALALGLSFRLGLDTMTNGIFLTLMTAGAVLPAYRAECLLGFVLGLSWFFGGVLPVIIGSVIIGLSALLHLGVYRGVAVLWRRWR